MGDSGKASPRGIWNLEDEISVVHMQGKDSITGTECYWEKAVRTEP